MVHTAFLRQFTFWIVLTNLITISAMLGFGYVWIERNIFQTSIKADNGFLYETAALLAKHYRYHGSWEPIVNHPMLWLSISRPMAMTPNPDGSYPTVEEVSRSLRVPPPRSGRPPGPPPQGRPPFAKRVPIEERLILKDKDHKVLRGLPGEKDVSPHFVPIQLQGEVIGYIGRTTPRHFISHVRQTMIGSTSTMVIMGIVTAIILSIVVALLVSYQLSRPLVSVSLLLRKLASGDFKQRMKPPKNKAYQTIGKDLNSLGEVLEENREIRQRWVSDISHELRTPLSILHAEIESAEAGIQGSSEDMMQSMREEIDQLNNLVGDLKTLSNADLGGLEFEKTDINLEKFLQQYTDKARNTLKKCDIAFELQCSQLPTQFTLFSDENRLRQVFDNLLQNSQRYTDPQGKVRVSSILEGNKLHITWEDSAPSVSAEALPKLFERLYREEQSRSRATGGSGLGLSICKSIVQSQQGRILARHSELGGLAIEISLPI
jgi:two-component system, OmpR family, sensor histidine kinase BaeS